MTINQMTWDEFEAVLAPKLPGYARREIQALLADKALFSLKSQKHILAQAGCGTGKSFIAAFVSLMISLSTGEPSVIATATKALQDQYAEKDLPFLAEILEGLRFVVLKGRANYVCLQKVDEIEDTVLRNRVLDRTDAEGFSGEIADLGFDVDSRYVSTTSEECPGKSQCPFGNVCFAESAKTKAKTAHIVVANHAVLAADLMVKEMQEMAGVPEDKTGGILPHYGLVVVDEGHEFMSSVTDALGGLITAGSYGRLASEVNNLMNDRHYADTLTEKSGVLFSHVARALAKREDKRASKLPMDDAVLGQISEAAVAVIEALAKLSSSVTKVQFHGDDKAQAKRKRVLKRIDNASDRLKRLVLADDEHLVRWLEVAEGKRGDAIGYAPLQVDEFLRGNLWDRVPSMVMSATLTTGGTFNYTKETLGIDEATEHDAGTPFDYEKQALIYVPELPAPAGSTIPAWRTGSLATMERLVTAAHGSALLLFTSRTEMDQAHMALAPKFRKMGLTVLKQGEATNKALAKEFHNDTHSVLFGLASFMTGVDFQGDTLRLVYINKLMFTPPTDVVNNARVALADKKARSWGEKGFMKITVPQMNLTLLQAFGRGVRTVNDHCLVVIGDSRLYGKNAKGYGGTIMKSFTKDNIPVTTSLDVAEEFLTERKPA